MGCASSSPLVTANGGVLGAAKGAATDAVHAGEEALHDAKGTINETVGHVKEAVVGAVHNVGLGIENAIHGKKEEKSDNNDIGVMSKDSTSTTEAGRETDFKIIPLKDPTERLEKSMEDMAETMQQNAEQVKEDADKLADDLMKETEDVAKDSIQETTEKVTSAVNKIVEKSPNHSIDSLKTNSPEPEIEKAMANDTSTNPPTPKPTIAELEQLQSAAETIISDVNAHTQNLAQVPLTNDTKTERGSHVFGNESIIINQALKSIETSAGTSDDEDFDFDFDRSRFPMPEDPTPWEKLADSLLQPKPNILKAFRDNSNREAPFIASAAGIEVAELVKDNERTILF